jgi:rhodanese-related sulfurtransferase
MSHEAAAELVRLGYTGVLNLSGGFLAWRAAGLPMEGI